jgi:hypothetical protein
MDKRFKAILDENGVGVNVKGTKENRLTQKLAADLFTAEDVEKPRILTKHGAHLVFQSVKGQRVSYKQIGAALVAEAQRIVAEAEQRHRVEIDAFVRSTEAARLPESENGHEAIDAPEDDTAETAGA